MPDLVISLARGAIVGYLLESCCTCDCHTDGSTMHIVACCVNEPGLETFPEVEQVGIGGIELYAPKAKLPNCPHCDEDELGLLHKEEILCYACGWRLVCGEYAKQFVHT